MTSESISIILTESVEQSKDLIRELYDAQLPVDIFPVIKTVPLNISDEIKAIYKNLDYFDWLLFSSMNDVRYFFFILLNQFIKLRSTGINIGVMGLETAATIKTYGKQADFIYPGFSFPDFCQTFLKKHNFSGMKILAPACATFNPRWLRPIEETVEQLTILPVYRSQPVRALPPQQILNLQQKEKAVVVFQSPMAVTSFMEFIPPDSISPLWKFITKDDLTAAALSRYKKKVDAIAQTPEQSSLFEAIQQVIAKN